LNGFGNIASYAVERVARVWASKRPLKRYVVKPKSAGSKAFFSISEILSEYQLLRDVRYICKIDDDIVPLKPGWLQRLADSFHTFSKKENVGFVTGLINNNCWGFDTMLDIFDMRSEYKQMYNYRIPSRTPDKWSIGEVDNGSFGTIWQEPSIAWWVHQWSSLKPQNFIDRTVNNPPYKEITLDTPYSIGCIFFDKDFWLNLNPITYNSDLDEDLIHKSCIEHGLRKFALMQEPIIHFFYANQRLPNRDLIAPFSDSLAYHFNDQSFAKILRAGNDDRVFSMEEKLDRFYYDFLTFLRSIDSD
jgi:hypothetical protein